MMFVEFRTLVFIIIITGETVQNNKNYSLTILEKKAIYFIIIVNAFEVLLLIVNAAYHQSLNDEKISYNGDDAIAAITIIIANN